MMAIQGLLDFAQLEQIQRLEAPLILFLGQTSVVNPTLAERLLPSLRSLSFNDDLALFNAYPWRATAVLEYFRCIFDRARAFNTGLTDLGLLLRECSEDWSDEDQAEFRKICHSAGFTSTTHRALRWKVIRTLSFYDFPWSAVQYALDSISTTMYTPWGLACQWKSWLRIIDWGEVNPFKWYYIFSHSSPFRVKTIV